MKNIGKHGIKNQNLNWFISFLALKKLCMPYGETAASLETIKFYPRSRHQRCSIKKDVLRNFTKFTGKHLC